MRNLLIVTLVLCAVLLVAGCSTREGGAGTEGVAPTVGVSDGPNAAAEQSSNLAEQSRSLYLSVVDGLHVTGTAVEVDARTYRLRIGGKVDSPLALSLEQIRDREAVRTEARLTCVGFFTDNGTWTGVPLKSLLEAVGVRKGASEVVLTSVDDSYSVRLSLQKALEPRMLVAYEFDDRPLHVLHGFPLRLVAPGEPGSTWIKWLGSITVE
jgi:DMSO/TMAO reductase YedYZ molybdopterin-dependent catalytic subunit